MCVFSDSYSMGGVGSAILEFMAEEDIANVYLKSFEIKDEFIPHGNTQMIESMLGLNAKDMALSIQNWLDSK